MTTGGSRSPQEEKRMYTFFIVPMIKNPAPVRSKCCRDGAQRFPDQKPVFGKISCKKKQAVSAVRYVVSNHDSDVTANLTTDNKIISDHFSSVKNDNLPSRLRLIRTDQNDNLPSRLRLIRTEQNDNPPSRLRLIRTDNPPNRLSRSE